MPETYSSQLVFDTDGIRFYLKSIWLIFFSIESTHAHLYLHVRLYCQRFENKLLQEEQEGPGSAVEQSWALKGKMYHHKLHHSVLAGELSLTPVRTFTAPHQHRPYCRAWNIYCSLQCGLWHWLFLNNYVSSLIYSPSSHSHPNLSKYKSRNIHSSNVLGAKYLLENTQFHKYHK